MIFWKKFLIFVPPKKGPFWAILGVPMVPTLGWLKGFHAKNAKFTTHDLEVCGNSWEWVRGHWISPLPCINKKGTRWNVLPTNFSLKINHWLLKVAAKLANKHCLTEGSEQLKIPGIEMFGKRSYLGLSQVVDRSVFCWVPTPYLMF